jgi:hypothetical protein
MNVAMIHAADPGGGTHTGRLVHPTSRHGVDRHRRDTALNMSVASCGGVGRQRLALLTGRGAYR